MLRSAGPIIRISPYELHINDPEYYDELYVGPSTRRTMKYEWAVRGFGPTDYAFSTVSHELHRIRRGALAPFFSKSLVQQLEPSVQTMVNKLMSRLESLKGSGAVINLINVFPCLTSDIICQYAFAVPYGYLDEPEFAPKWHKAVMEASEANHFFKQFPWIETIMRNLPRRLVETMAPNLSSLFLINDMVHEKVVQVQADLAEGKQIQSQNRTIFHDLLANNTLPPEEKKVSRLEVEGMALVAAGAMTVAHTLSVISYHILNNTKVATTLRRELMTALPKMSSPPAWNQLEQLPYLTAVIQEGLRWAHGVSHRLQRISPDVDLQYKDYTIPRGTPVGMTSVLQHAHPDAYAHGELFDPQRWLGDEAQKSRKYLVAFSRGSRQCLGINLAYCELYLTLAAMFGPSGPDMELYETRETDAEVYHDYFNACQRHDSKGVRVKML
ncbi:MAG: hypothetical protein M1828_007621 [Chrysothrix sp. TS-e1954]|nr:MAG: hypothetical protein M1828_007621 [Chrysothrix sp. TS-e1954]